MTLSHVWYSNPSEQLQLREANINYREKYSGRIFRTFTRRLFVLHVFWAISSCGLILFVSFRFVETWQTLGQHYGWLWRTRTHHLTGRPRQAKWYRFMETQHSTYATFSLLIRRLQIGLMLIRGFGAPVHYQPQQFGAIPRMSLEIPSKMTGFTQRTCHWIRGVGPFKNVCSSHATWHKAILWECCEVFLDELLGQVDEWTLEFNNLIPKSEFYHHLVNFAAMKKDLAKAILYMETTEPYGVWHNVINEYWRMNLTVKEDRVMAFVGIARAFHSFTGWTYTAGL